MRYNYVKYDEEATRKQESFKKLFEQMDEFVNSLEDGRAKSLVFTKLEESYMWVGKSIRDSQVKRGSQTQHIASRDNS